MAINIPDSFRAAKKVIVTPRTGLTIGRTVALDKVKQGIIGGQVAAKVDLFPDESVKSAQLGTPVVDQVILKTAIDSTADSDVFKFDSVLVTVTQTKNIVKTPIQGRNGTVKEYISDGDYDISVKGIIVSTYSERSPREAIEQLVSLLKLPNEIVIECDYLAIFGISYVVVENFNFSQVEGSINQIQMDLKLISDQPVELKLGIDSNA